MFNPPRPGETLWENILPGLGLTVTEAARQLDVTRTALSRVLNGHAASPPKWHAVSKPGSAQTAAVVQSCG